MSFILEFYLINRHFICFRCLIFFSVSFSVYSISLLILIYNLLLFYLFIHFSSCRCFLFTMLIRSRHCPFFPSSSVPLAKAEVFTENYFFRTSKVIIPLLYQGYLFSVGSLIQRFLRRKKCFILFLLFACKTLNMEIFNIIFLIQSKNSRLSFSFFFAYPWWIPEKSKIQPIFNHHHFCFQISFRPLAKQRFLLQKISFPFSFLRNWYPIQRFLPHHFLHQKLLQSRDFYREKS